nr:hypothetical protein g202 [Fusarium commune]
MLSTNLFVVCISFFSATCAADAIFCQPCTKDCTPYLGNTAPDFSTACENCPGKPNPLAIVANDFNGYDIYCS